MPLRQKSIPNNFFLGMREIVCKAKFAYLLNRLQSLFPKHYTFYPRTWIALQEMMTEVIKLSAKELNSMTFIVKPDGGSEGRGIFLLQGLKQLETLYFQITESVVIQKYISNPYLIDGFKFDLRLYAVLTNLNPLETYLFRDGLARFCTVPYQAPNSKNMRHTCMHLTNYSLNKNNPSFILMNNPHEGSKRTITSVFQIMENLGHSIDIIWLAIEQLIAKTIIAMLPSLKIEFDSWNTIHKIPDNKFSCFHVSKKSKDIFHFVYCYDFKTNNTRICMLYFNIMTICLYLSVDITFNLTTSISVWYNITDTRIATI